MTRRASALVWCVFAALWSNIAFAQAPRHTRVFEVQNNSGRVSCNVVASSMDIAPDVLSAMHVINPHVNATGMTINLVGTSQLDGYPSAKAAFVRAAAEWEQYLTSPITLQIYVDYGPTIFGKPYSNADILGSTSTDEHTVSYSDVKAALSSSIQYTFQQSLYGSLPSALPTDLGTTTTVDIEQAEMRAIGMLPATPSSSDAPAAKIGFNSTHSFDFDNSNGISSGAVDFQSVAAHEIGHALGFVSDVGWTELSSSLPLAATPLDFFRFRPGTGSSFSTAPRILSSGGQQNFYNSIWESALSTGRADHTGGDGQQASHWKEWAISGEYIGLMNPTLGSDTIAYLTVDDLVAFSLLGYQVQFPDSPAAPSNLAATLSGATQVNLTWNDNSNNESEFRLEVSTNGGSSWTDVGGIPANRTSASLSRLAASTAFKFRLFATNAGGQSTRSNEVSITTGSAVQPTQCVPGPTTACMLNGRFQVTVHYWNDFVANPVETPAFVKNVGSAFASSTFETAFFYFNSDNNIEVLTKTLDQGTGKIDFLFGTASPLRMVVTIVDTKTGQSKSYSSAFGSSKGGGEFGVFVK